MSLGNCSSRHRRVSDENATGVSLVCLEVERPTINNFSSLHRELVSHQTLSYFMLINFWGPGQCVTLVGLVVNILNVVTFVKQGVKDSVNISLLALTISDLGSLVFLFFLNLCWTPPIMKMDLPFIPLQMMYIMFYGHLVFTRVTTGTTAWIAFERCMCIVSPLQIKSLITPRRTVIFISALYVIMMAAVSPIIYTSRFSWKFVASRNRTLVVLSKIPNRDTIENVAFLVNNILPVVFFIFIVICTGILVRALKQNAKWRQQTISLKLTKNETTRDTKVVKMVVIISTVFIFCYAPGAVSFIWVIIDPEIKIDGSQKNLMFAVFSVLLQLEGINATANFFVYITMSSNFKATFKKMFSLGKQ